MIPTCHVPNSWNGHTALQYARAKKDTRLLDLLHPRWREDYLAGHSPSAPMKKGVCAGLLPLLNEPSVHGIAKRL